MDLVMLKKNEAFTNSLVISEGTGIEHESIQRLIRSHKQRLERFGKVGFEIRALKSGQHQKNYLLNEQQATFLITLLRNTEVVLNFKAELVNQFFAMRKLLLEKQTLDWQESRKLGKLTRNTETDTIKQLTEYAKAQGSKNGDKLYLVYSKLANRIVGIGSRDNATAMQLSNLSVAENIILMCIRECMSAGKQYRQIYQACKTRLEQFKDVAYIT